jgi:hypothetical protein
MAFNFPDGAVNGNTYTASNGLVYVYNGEVWLVQNAGTMASFDTKYAVSGSYETTGRTIVSSSAQITSLGFISSSSAPVGTISSSAQITSFGFVSGSYETTGRGIVSSSAQIAGLGYATTGSNSFNGNQIITGSLTASLQTGYTWVGNGNNVSTAFPTSSLLSTASFNSFTSSQFNTLSASVATVQTNLNAVTASLGVTSTAFSYTAVTNPTAYVLVQYLTSSYNGGTFDILMVNTGNSTATSANYQFASYGANAGISQNGKQTSGAGGPSPSMAIAVSGSYMQIKVTETGTFNIKGVARLF